ncbi:MAG: carboxypeptidase regulatory-like domain-containing protein [Candidatus Korarchaeota archaeon]|nr:carboxypeptidase regulatory-like domain-containing protein [Candidatus Korarchaeota archaeon]
MRREAVASAALMLFLFTPTVWRTVNSSPSYSVSISVTPEGGSVGDSFTTSVRVTVDGLQAGTAYAVFTATDPDGRERYYRQSPQWTYADMPVDYRTAWTLTVDKAGTWTSCVSLVFDGEAPDGSGYQDIIRCVYFEASDSDDGGGEGGGGGNPPPSKKPTKLTIAANPSTVESGKTFSVGGGLFDASQSDWWNYPIAGATITVTFNGRTRTTTTRSDGGWSVVFTAPTQEGTYAVRASFAGNSQYDRTSASATVRVQRPSKRDCIVELIYPEKVHVGDIVNITVVLRDAETHQEIKGKVVTLYIEADSHQIESGSSFTIQAEYPGTIDVGARFEGDSEYNGAYDPGGLIEVWTRPRITITYVGCGEE